MKKYKVLSAYGILKVEPKLNEYAQEGFEFKTFTVTKSDDSDLNEYIAILEKDESN